MRQKPIYVTRSSMPSLDEYVNEIKSIWDTHMLTNMGRYHNELEKKLEDFLKVDNVSLFTNGHLSLELAIEAMNLSGEVITTPFTFASTTHAIVRNKLDPVFCDINTENYTIDVTKIEQLITDKTSAIIPVHVYGNICDVEAIQKIAEKHNLKVIYDAAHAFGETYKSNGIGSFGDLSMFSFHATKVFNTIEGGAIAFNNNTELKDRLLKLKNFGIESEDVVDVIGSNAKMNEFQATMGICNLRHLDNEINKRKKVVERYYENLANVDGIQLVKHNHEVKYNYSYLPVLFVENIFGATRDDVCEELKKNNIFARKYFYPLTNTFECFNGRYNVEDTPNALYVSKRVLTLPLYADLSFDDVDEICNIILSLKK